MKIINRSAYHEYRIIDRYEAGIKLFGQEVKSVKLGHVSLKGSHVRLIDDEAFLINAQIQPYTYARYDHYDSKRTRKLLFHKQQIYSLITKLESQKATLVPLSMYTVKNLVKVEVGLAKGKKQFEKREALKRQVEKRELERDFRGKLR